jgi:hypothetical protein
MCQLKQAGSGAISLFGGRRSREVVASLACMHEDASQGGGLETAQTLIDQDLDAPRGGHR